MFNKVITGDFEKQILTTMPKKIVALLAVSLIGILALAESETRRLDSYDFSVAGKSVEAGESIFYDISYTPHKSISPIHIYIIARSELAFTEDQLAAMFEFLSHDSFIYYDKDVLSPLNLPESGFDVLSKRSGGKDNFAFIRER